MGRRNFPLGGYSQPGSRDAGPWLASPSSTLRGGCAPSWAAQIPKEATETPPPHCRGDRLPSPGSSHSSSLGMTLEGDRDRGQG